MAATSCRASAGKWLLCHPEFAEVRTVVVDLATEINYFSGLFP